MLNNLIRVLTIIAISATFSIIPTQAYAANSALMDLIQILKNKGSITEEEFQLLQKAAVAEGQQQTAPQQAATVTAPETKTAVAEVKPAPASWTNKISLRGDARLRYQTQDNDPGISAATAPVSDTGWV